MGQIKNYLEYYQKTRILRTTLLIEAGIETAHEISIPNYTISNEWKEVIEDINSIKKEIKKFHNICWPDIQKRHYEEKKYSLFRFIFKDVQLLSMDTMGRILNTISKNDDMVTISGASNIKNNVKCGLQGIDATKNKANELIQIIVSTWDPDKFNVHESEFILISD